MSARNSPRGVAARLHVAIRWGYISAALASFGVAGVALVGSRGQVSVPQILVFCVLPAFVGGTCLAALRLNEDTRVNLLLALLSSGVALYTAELALAYHLEREATARRSAQAVAASWDDRTRIQVAMDLRREGVNAYPRLSGPDLRQIQLEIDGNVVQPLAPSIAGALVVLCRETDQYVTYRADEHGFNNPEGAWGDAQVVVIGDSYVHGYCVPEGESLAHLLRRRWPRLLNLGVAGTGPLWQLAVLKEYAAAKRPRTVIWVHYEGNDLSDLSAEEANPILSAYLEPGFSQGLLRNQEALDALLARRVAQIVGQVGEGARGFSSGRSFASRAREALALRVLRDRAGIGVRFPRSQPSLGSLPTIYREAKRTVEAWGGRIHLVYMPTLRRYRSWLGEPILGRHELLGAAAELGIPVIDLEPSFRATGEPQRLWLPGGHLDPAGYALAAERITAEVSD